MKKILLTFIFIIISTNLLAFEKDTNFTIEDFKKAQNDGKKEKKMGDFSSG